MSTDNPFSESAQRHAKSFEASSKAAEARITEARTIAKQFYAHLEATITRPGMSCEWEEYPAPIQNRFRPEFPYKNVIASVFISNGKNGPVANLLLIVDGGVGTQESHATVTALLGDRRHQVATLSSTRTPHVDNEKLSDLFYDLAVSLSGLPSSSVGKSVV